MKNFYLYLLFLVVFLPFKSRAQLLINEFLALNNNVNADAYGEFDDWIEIYNSSADSINLAGLFLTDDLNQPTQWPFPDTVLPGKSYLLIWADADTSQGALHTNFKLNGNHEQIGLYDGTQFLDSLSYHEQISNSSYGRYPDASAHWCFFENPTPGSANQAPVCQIAKKPLFSKESGFYRNSIQLHLQTTSPNASIYYTLNGAVPDTHSVRYTTPLVIDTTTVIRARTFTAGLSPSEIVTHTYIFNRTFNIATLSLVTDPLNLWDPDSGIYVNPEEKGENWERAVSVQFFETPNELTFSIDAGLRIHGNSSRRYDKKPFRLYFRSEYGQSCLEYSLFDTKPEITEFKRLVVHSGGTDTPKNPFGKGWTLLRDPLMQEMGRRCGAIYTANRPVAVFLNGQPWGIYNCFERIDRYFTEANFGEEDVDILDMGYVIKEGDHRKYKNMVRFFEEHWNSSNYEKAELFLDIPNFFNYCILQIYGGNLDWPHNNFLSFRPRREEAVWRWILWDMDACFIPYALASNAVRWATRDDPSTLILRKLLESPFYRNLFITRFTDLLNTVFLPEQVIHLIDSFANNIRPDIAFETNKWGSSSELWEQEGIVERLYDFANKRPELVRKHLGYKFGLKGPVNLTMNPPEGGQGLVRINSLKINHFPWNGLFFKYIPIEFEAMPAAGFRFKKWSDPNLPDSNIVVHSISEDYSLYPIFEKEFETDPIVINEINYHSANYFDPKDWIEIHNLTDQTVDISGWYFKDSDEAHEFIFPANSKIEANHFLILCQDPVAFHTCFPNVKNVTGHFEFGLNNGGELIRLFDANRFLVDSLSYDAQAPWPIEADGQGPTLELINPTSDNSLPQNWQASNGYGSPGAANQYNPPPFLSVNPESLDVILVEKRKKPFRMYLKITHKSYPKFNWNAFEAPDKSWLDLKLDNNDSSERIIVTFNPMNLAKGEYRSSIQITETNAPTNFIEVPVKLQIVPRLRWIKRIESKEPPVGALVDSNEPEFYPEQSADAINHPNFDTLSYDLICLDFEIKIPAGIEEIFFFSETTDTSTVANGDFWIKVGQPKRCCWQTASATTQDRIRAWAINPDNNALQRFKVAPGWNVIKLYCTPAAPSIKWLAVTTDSTLAIEDYQFQLQNEVNHFVRQQDVICPLPKDFYLYQNFPNPFNAVTKLTIDIPIESQVKISVFNALGQRIKEFINTTLPAGSYQFVWDACDQQKKPVPNGIYYCVFQTQHSHQIRKIIVLR